MAYKDEYEVARLHLKSRFSDAITDEFGPNASVKFMLHPPLLRAMGMQKKIALGSWIRPFFKLLAAMKFLRGTPLDIFGKVAVRREEQRLPEEYKAMIEQELEYLSPITYATATALAEAPDIIRGYEDIKLANIKKYRQHLDEIQEKRPVASVD